MLINYISLNRADVALNPTIKDRSLKCFSDFAHFAKLPKQAQSHIAFANVMMVGRKYILELRC